MTRLPDDDGWEERLTERHRGADADPPRVVDGPFAPSLASIDGGWVLCPPMDADGFLAPQSDGTVALVTEEGVTVVLLITVTAGSMLFAAGVDEAAGHCHHRCRR